MRTLSRLCIIGLASACCTLVHAGEADTTQQPKPKIVRMPSFQGGDINAFAHWISERLEYPPEMNAKGVRGRVVVKFIIEKDGTLTFQEILESPDTVLSRAVVLLALQAPRWKPAIWDNSQPGRCFIVLPVNFKLPAGRRHLPDPGNRFGKEFRIPQDTRRSRR